jgi:hypothetical protein
VALRPEAERPRRAGVSSMRTAAANRRDGLNDIKGSLLFARRDALVPRRRCGHR